jgi:sporulation protein YlmC with PRC-barrel domain
MDIRRQILDQQLIDRTGVNIGKIEGVVLELRDEQPPRIAAVLTGGHVLAHRLHPRIASWVRRLTRKWGPNSHNPIRIPWSRVKKIGVDVRVDIAAQDVVPWEHWIRDRIIGRIPGA